MLLHQVSDSDIIPLVRLIIVCTLLQKEMCAKELLAIVGTTKGNISQHLKLLVLRKLISKRKEGNRTYFCIADHNLKTVIECLNRCYCQKYQHSIT